MVIHVYTLCWNEEKILPFFIRYYQQFCDKIIVYDNESTDASKDIICASPICEYRSYSSNNQIRDDLYLEIKNNVWKESIGVADWVIVVDTDEFIYAPKGVPAALSNYSKLGIPIVYAKGYNMLTDAFDWDSKDQITDLVRSGIRWDPQTKPAIFSPNKVKDINYSFGAHECYPSGFGNKIKKKISKKLVSDQIQMLHYKHLTLTYILEKYKVYQQRISAFNNEKGLGSHYFEKENELINQFNWIKENMSEVIK